MTTLFSILVKMSPVLILANREREGGQSSALDSVLHPFLGLMCDSPTKTCMCLEVGSL